MRVIFLSIIITCFIKPQKWLDAMAAAAPGGEEDDRVEDLGDLAMPMAMGEEGGDEESWYDSILSHAERTSVGKFNAV